MPYLVFGVWHIAILKVMKKMNIRDLLNKEFIYFDGGMGTLLQERGLKPGEKPENWNVTHGDVITEIHLNYLRAGSNIITTNTFGANSLKFSCLEDIISSAVKNARRAVELFDGDKEKCFVAFDIGPLGKLLEPLGELEFEKAVEIFSETVKIAEKYKPDLYIIETMNDSYETKAAVLAVKENSDLPVFVSNVFDESHRLLTGADGKTMIATLEGLGVDAVGMNCSLGPVQMKEIAKEYARYSSLPVMVSPNAGLPVMKNGKTVFDVSPEEFALCMREIALSGVQILGGCCGTTPEYIRATVQKTKDVPFVPQSEKNYTVVSSYAQAVTIGDCPVLIGERINPTGKPKFRQALRDGDMDYIVNEGISQQEKGVHILDVNVGLPEIDEDKMLVGAVKALQAVSTLPLQLDTVKISAMEKAMRIYNGKPLINSVNGKKESMDAVLPLVKKYGGTVIALTIDEKGIPETAQGRWLIAEKIIKECEKYGIKKKDIIVDPLAMTVSSDNQSGRVTLEAVKLIKEKSGVKTSLGVSNISFGLPNRDIINSHFFTMALTMGLDCAIMNPYSLSMMESYHSFKALQGLDENCAEYIGFAFLLKKESVTVKEIKAQEDKEANGLVAAIVKGLKSGAFTCADEMTETAEPLEIINEYIVPALDKVGKAFEEKKMYLPELLMSAEAASKAFEAVKAKMQGKSEEKGEIILATVKGDIHDIGKNIVKVLLENYGYKVIDLGKDVAPETVLEKARERKVKLVGLSALMTTTTAAMEETVKLLKKELPQVKTVVGGAVLTKEYARMIGASYYAKDAMETVRYAEKVFCEK